MQRFSFSFLQQTDLTLSAQYQNNHAKVFCGVLRWRSIKLSSFVAVRLVSMLSCLLKSTAGEDRNFSELLFFGVFFWGEGGSEEGVGYAYVTTLDATVSPPLRMILHYNNQRKL